MLVFAICDDNPQFAKLLSERIYKYCVYNIPERIEARIAPVFTSARSVIEYASGNQINILFLDIDMPEVNGFELAGIMKKEYPDTIIVFVSAYDEYVYNSFEYSPFRFLRKSHLDEELPKTLEKVVEKCALDSEVVEFHTTEGTEIIRIKNIIYIEGQKNYYLIHTLQNTVYRCRGTMGSAETLLADYDFFRVHSAFLVNMDHIESVGSNGIIVMCDQSDISVSKRRLTNFKDKYLEFIRRRVMK